jgi:hypothetical protein
MTNITIRLSDNDGKALTADAIAEQLTGLSVKDITPLYQSVALAYDEICRNTLALNAALPDDATRDPIVDGQNDYIATLNYRNTQLESDNARLSELLELAKARLDDFESSTPGLALNVALDNFDTDALDSLFSGKGGAA